MANVSPKAIDGTTDLSIEYGVILADGRILGVTSFAGGVVFFFDADGPSGFNRSGHDIFNYFLINARTLGEHKGCENTMQKLKSGIYPESYGSCYEPFTTYSREELLGTSIHRSCNKNAQKIGKGGGGDACAALIMQDGWEMKKDYPAW